MKRATKQTVLRRVCAAWFPGLSPEFDALMLAKGLSHEEVIISLEPKKILSLNLFLVANATAALWAASSWSCTPAACITNEPFWVYLACAQQPFPADGGRHA